MSPTKKTDVTIAKILSMLMVGNTLETAALAAHIHPRTLRQWMSEDEELELKILEAEATFEADYLDIIDRTAKGDSNKALDAAKWVLERRNPAAWAPASRNDMFTRYQQVKELAEELRSEGYSITEEQLMKELSNIEKKALPSGKKK